VCSSDLDVLRVGPGSDEVFGEPGGDTIYLLNDGAPDTVYCGQVAGGEPGDKVVLVNGRDPLDDVRNCPQATSQRMVGSWDTFRLTLR